MIHVFDLTVIPTLYTYVKLTLNCTYVYLNYNVPGPL